MLATTSCYDDYISDYEEPTVYFATQQPIRTVVADRDLTVRVGATVAGIRAVDTSDWATFEIDETLLDGEDADAMKLELLPATHYTLADATTMRISNATLPIVDVEISFTEEFFADPKSTELYYALPFRLTDSSRDAVLESQSTSIVAIKYVSTYSGTYYVEGQVYDTSAPTDVWAEYIESALNSNKTSTLTTVDRTTLTKSSLTISSDVSSGTIETGELTLTFDAESMSVEVTAADGNTQFQSGRGSFHYEEVEYYDRLVSDLDYTILSNGVTYRLCETLTRQKDPYAALEWEVWEAPVATE